MCISEKMSERNEIMKRVTIQDIAKELEMSRNTVAKAFNNGAILPETKKMVIKKQKVCLQRRQKIRTR